MVNANANTVFFIHVALVTTLSLFAMTRREVLAATWFKVSCLALFSHILFTDLAQGWQACRQPHVAAVEPETHNDVAAQPPDQGTGASVGEFYYQNTPSLGHKRVMQPLSSPHDLWKDAVSQEPFRRGRPLELTRSYSSWVPELD